MAESVLVTGAAGFIGGHCCKALLDLGYHVRGVDNFDPFYPRAIKEEALAALSGRENFQFVEGDIRDQALVSSIMGDVAAVIHLAARAGVRPSIADPVAYSSINVQGTVQLLECAHRAGIRRFVFGSSSSVYGDTTPPPFREDAPSVDPISPYAATKRSGELLCQVYHHLYGMRIASLRFFTVYGPRQRPDLAIHKFTRLLSSGRPIEQYGDGGAERDYTHIGDIIQGVIGALLWTEASVPAFEVFNLGESRTVSLSRLIELISTELGVRAEIVVCPPQAGDVRRTYASIEKAKAVLGYSPKTVIEEGIAEFVNWYEGAHGD